VPSPVGDTAPTRARVLALLREHAVPHDAAAVAAALGLHLTTARFHLERLAEAGLAARATRPEARRGRPRVVYDATGAARDDDTRTRLIGVLAAALAGTPHGEADAVEAGRAWAASYPAAEAQHPEQAVVAALDRLGFAPTPAPAPVPVPAPTSAPVPAPTPASASAGADNTAITLRACPFRDAARAHPQVVCAVHRGFVERMLEGTRTVARLEPFATDDTCVVRMLRAG